MKKVLALILSIATLIGSLSLTALAQDTPKTARVYVTVSSEGKLVMSQEAITVTDRNNDGTLDLDEALYAAHEASYEGGAATGYASGDDGYGLFVTKLWGIENGGSYGYYINNTSPENLEETVKDGDFINAFSYAESDWSDIYCWFDKNTLSTDKKNELSLTLTGMLGYDYNTYEPIIGSVKNAIITINGKETEYKTDENGRVSFKMPESGKCIISAVSKDDTLVPPVCIATVTSDEVIKAYVTISDKDGRLAMAQEEITVTDIDKDGYITINDTLYAAHEKSYDGGAAAGYASAVTEYGLSMTKLWGAENGGSYGYYVNNGFVTSLTATVKNGDFVNAFVYTDLTSWSDTYCYFDKNTATVNTGDEITLTLSAMGYNADGKITATPVSNAVITLNGEKTALKTDKDGKATIKAENAGSLVVSAVSDAQILVPPVCLLTVNAKAEVKADTDTNSGADINNKDNTSTEEIVKTGDSSAVLLIAMLSLASVAVLLLSSALKNKLYEER